jgi:hypothetical protein
MGVTEDDQIGGGKDIRTGKNPFVAALAMGPVTGRRARRWDNWPIQRSSGRGCADRSGRNGKAGAADPTVLETCEAGESATATAPRGGRWQR